jgi:two-component system, cell cycle sensor histidine kinase and response regulator CckA
MSESNIQKASSSSWIPTRTRAIRLSLWYALLSSLWILLSGWLLHLLVKDHNLAVSLENVKGWFFVSVTAFLLYLALDRYFREIRKSAQLLQESKQRWQFALESAGHGVWDWNAQTDQVFYSASWKRMLGFEPHEIGNMLDEWKTRVHPEDLPRVLNEIEQHFAGKTPTYVSEHRIRCKDGNFVWILDQGKIMSRAGNGKPLRVLGTHLDITERKRNEREKAELERHLQQAQKMESVGRLAGGVAHDFNNMLGAILGYVELALEQVDCKNPIYSDLEEIRKAARRSADLTRQLLAFARRQTIVLKVLDVNNTIASILKMLQRLIGEHIDLEWLPDPEVWPVEMDPTQIDQMLTNLCVNARDAIANIGRIAIRTENCIFDEQYCACYPTFLPGEYVVLTVSDNGRGMDIETQKQIFEPFFTTKNVGLGTGLGLAMIYGIVKQNNGFIHVDSAPGHGTTFKIYLPRYGGKPAGIQMESMPIPEKCGQETILLVEDEPSLLKMATRMLQQQGYNVLAAPSPGEAMRIAREHTRGIQILVTNLVMPEMNGRDLAKSMLALYPHIKNLFMSGYSAAADAPDAISKQDKLEPGAHFLPKPFSMKELAAAVRRSLDSD